VVLFVAVAKSMILELTSRFLAFYIMDVMGICYPQYWFQGDAKENFNCHLKLIKLHYCIERHLELVKLLDSSTSLEVNTICPSILSAMI
jgi:hypothetical protein